MAECRRYWRREMLAQGIDELHAGDQLCARGRRILCFGFFGRVVLRGCRFRWRWLRGSYIRRWWMAGTAFAGGLPLRRGLQAYHAAVCWYERGAVLSGLALETAGVCACGDDAADVSGRGEVARGAAKVMSRWGSRWWTATVGSICSTFWGCIRVWWQGASWYAGSVVCVGDLRGGRSAAAVDDGGGCGFGGSAGYGWVRFRKADVRSLSLEAAT